MRDFEIFGICNDKTVNTSYTWWNYREEYDIDFLTINGTNEITEIRFNTGFPGKTLDNNITLNSTLSEVKGKYPGYTEVTINSVSDWTAGSDNVLYTIDDGINPICYRFAQINIIFWFFPAENITQIVVY